MLSLEWAVELGDEVAKGQRWASITLDGMTVFSELVYDNRESPAERNIVLLFKERLRDLIERD